MVAVLASVGTFCLIRGVRRRDLITRLAPYLEGAGPPTRRRIRLPRASAPMVLGALIGVTIADEAVALGASIGAVVGAVADGIRRRAIERRRRAMIGQELPAIADLLSLHVMSGDTVLGAMKRLADECAGIAAGEIRTIVTDVAGGVGLHEAVRSASRTAAHPDAGRLYEILAEAHRSGARLVDSLAMFAQDRRAAIARDLAAEGGRRALTGYGPILGLMIPTTLVFLMYPTLAGLRALSAP